MELLTGSSVKRFLRSASVLITGCLLSSLASADTVKLRADYWPPYNGDAGEERPGYMIDIAREIWDDAGFTLEYATIPWERAITEARSGAVDCIVGALPSEVPDFIFHRIPLGVDQSAFYVRHDQEWSYIDDTSLNGIRLGVIGGYSYDQGDVDRRIEQALASDIPSSRIQVMKGDNALEKNLQKLISGRIDAVIGSATVVDYTINKLGFNNAVNFAGAVGVADPLFIACSPDSPSRSRQLVTLLHQGIVRMRASGRLDEILQHYGLRDWAQPPQN